MDPLSTVLGRIGFIRMSWPRHVTEPLRTTEQGRVGVAPSFFCCKKFILFFFEGKKFILSLSIIVVDVYIADLWSIAAT